MDNVNYETSEFKWISLNNECKFSLHCKYLYVIKVWKNVGNFFTQAVLKFTIVIFRV